ncbi:MAG: hypothetical protein WA989_10445, partial [Henriciella sp.]|uniref:hypothetical protein n=1 Tax=Henriciella sp. TaxID=1968823 RepID=UPI003C720C14
MRLTILAGCTAFALAACGGQDGPGEDTQLSTLDSDCEILTSDPEAQENFDEIGITADQFCDCFIQVVDEKGEAQQAQIRSTMERVTDGMEEDGSGAEEVVSGLMTEIMSATEQSQESQDLSAGIRLIGEAIDDIS